MTPPRFGAIALAAALAVLPVAAPAGATSLEASPQFSDTAGQGTWYYSDFGMDALHDAGVTGEGVTIAVFDSPINTEVDDLADADLDLRTSEICDNGFDGRATDEDAGHATNMISVIAGNGAGAGGIDGVRGIAPDAHVLHYAVIYSEAYGCRPSLAAAARDAIDNGAQIFSMSIGWGDKRDLTEAVRIAHEGGAVVNIAVQNEDGDALDVISGANGVVAIENVDVDGESDGMEVVSDRLTAVAPGVNIRAIDGSDGAWERYGLSVGTSPATAWTSGAIALGWSQWPEATSNQMIQSLIRNTSNGWEELTRTDEEGFGLVSPHNLAAVDPTQYPDENPLLIDTSDAYPSWSEVRGDATPNDWGFTTADIPRGSSTPVDDATKGPQGGVDLRLVVFAIVVVLAGIAIVITVVVLATRGKRRAGAPQPAWSGGYGAPGVQPSGFAPPGWSGAPAMPSPYGYAAPAPQYPHAPPTYGYAAPPPQYPQAPPTYGYAAPPPPYPHAPSVYPHTAQPSASAPPAPWPGQQPPPRTPPGVPPGNVWPQPSPGQNPWAPRG